MYTGFIALKYISELLMCRFKYSPFKYNDVINRQLVIVILNDYALQIII